jgi:hypothetical protein
MRFVKLSAISLTLVLVVVFQVVALGAQAADFKAGVAKVDITPTKAVPMWGYGERHAELSKGTRDPLMAKALVIKAGEEKLALVGLDLGRSPTAAMMANIRKAIADAAGIKYLMIVGSHTHYGPVIELKNEEGKGKGKFDDAVAYVDELEKKLIDVILSADKNLQDARIGWGSDTADMNTNRHVKGEEGPADQELAVIRVDDLSGKPIAVVTNFAAHPTSLSPKDLMFSAEYPGQLQNAVEAAMNCPCLFMQGACGDLTTKKGGMKSIEEFGKALGDKVTAVASKITTSAPENPTIQGMDEDFSFQSRMDMGNPIVRAMYQKAFFPELVAGMDEFNGNTIKPHLTTILLNGQLALVGGSGEFFCNHSLRLKERARGVKTLFFGYCNGHHMYFPTIEATAQGGYGADPTVSWVALGGPEEMMNKALINIYTMLGKYPDLATMLAGEKK